MRIFGLFLSFLPNFLYFLSHFSRSPSPRLSSRPNLTPNNFIKSSKNDGYVLCAQTRLSLPSFPCERRASSCSLPRPLGNMSFQEKASIVSAKTFDGQSKVCRWKKVRETLMCSRQRHFERKVFASEKFGESRARRRRTHFVVVNNGPAYRVCQLNRNKGYLSYLQGFLLLEHRVSLKESNDEPSDITLYPSDSTSFLGLDTLF